MKSLQEAVINRMEQEILLNIFGDTHRKLFTTSSARFSEFDCLKVILLQIKVFDRNIKETTQETYFIKVTTHLTFTRLRVISLLWKLFLCTLLPTVNKF